MSGKPKNWRWDLWWTFRWLPAPAYYRLGDVLVGLDGWRPLSYRENKQRSANA